MGKSLWASKTLWFNGLTMLATGIGFVSTNLAAQPTIVATLVLVQALCNIVLRFMTAEPLK